MKILTPQDKIEKTTNSVFLAGTTPKSRKKDWREMVIRILCKNGFDGTIYNPDYTKLKNRLPYKDQILWEITAMKSSEVVAFWVDRDLPKRPGLTTNVEFGYHLPRSNVVYGRPDKSEKCFYLDYIYELEQNKKPINSLEAFCDEIMKRLEQ